MARSNKSTRKVHEASGLLLHLKWISLIVFLVSGSVLWQQMNNNGIHHHNNPDDHHHHPHHEWMNLPLDNSMPRRDDFMLRQNNNNNNSNNAIATDDTCQAEYDRATVDRTPGLTLDDLERSRALVGNRHRLATLAETLRAGDKPLLAVVCGGSITLGHGVVPYVYPCVCVFFIIIGGMVFISQSALLNSFFFYLFFRPTMRYSDRLKVWLNDKYPLKSGRTHEVLNRGAHGADVSFYNSICFFLSLAPGRIHAQESLSFFIYENISS